MKGDSKMKKRYNPWYCTHTHTCTFKKWSKGGSREQLEEVSILPRDCE